MSKVYWIISVLYILTLRLHLNSTNPTSGVIPNRFTWASYKTLKLKCSVLSVKTNVPWMPAIIRLNNNQNKTFLKNLIKMNDYAKWFDYWADTSKVSSAQPHAFSLSSVHCMVSDIIKTINGGLLRPLGALSLEGNLREIRKPKVCHLMMQSRYSTCSHLMTILTNPRS